MRNDPKMQMKLLQSNIRAGQTIKTTLIPFTRRWLNPISLTPPKRGVPQMNVCAENLQ
jgi:hypothetical protein